MYRIIVVITLCVFSFLMPLEGNYLCFIVMFSSHFHLIQWTCSFPISCNKGCLIYSISIMSNRRLLCGDWSGFTLFVMVSVRGHHSLLYIWGARWLSGRVSDSGARGRGFETYRRRVVSLSKALYSPKVLVNYPGSGGSVPTWLKNCWLGR